jgi:hypothetical protein
MTSDTGELLVDRRWDSDLLDSTEQFTVHSHPDGYRFAGNTLIRHEGIRVEIDYVVEARPDWSTRSAKVDIPAVATHFEVEVSPDGRWVIDGAHRPDLEGCVDIDLGWTPATNSLPIRRLPFKSEIPVTTRVGWLKWSELVFMPAEQSYTKHVDGRWTYASGNFSADLVVDELGVAIDYGDPPIWRAVT